MLNQADDGIDSLRVGSAAALSIVLTCLLDHDVF